MIRRAEHSADKRFFLFTRKTAQDKNISFQAKGLLTYVLSKPANWTCKDSDLMKMGGIKQHALNTILSELKKHGYARRVRERKKGGKFEFFLEIAEEPIFAGESPLCDFPVVDEPVVDNQVVAIDSTCASAGSLGDLTDLREKEKPRSVKAYKQEPKPPEPKFLYPPPDFAINAALYVWLAENCFAFSDDELKTATQTWRESRASQPFTKTRTLAMWESDWQKFIRAYWGIRQQQKARSNGNGNGQEYTGPVKSKPNPRAENCPDCRGMLNILVEVDGVKYSKVCKHERSGVAAA